MITIFFRYDDYSAMSHPAVDKGLIDVFQKLGLSCTFAIVPSMSSGYPGIYHTGMEITMSPEKAEELRNAVTCGAVDPALHGLTHTTNDYKDHPTPSEFIGLSEAEQLLILKKGKESIAALSGHSPTVFVPPWNSYDQITVSALEKAGFKGLSANRYAPAATQQTKLKFCPMTTEIPGMRTAISYARENHLENSIIGVMLHPYDFKESGDARGHISLDAFEAELQWLLDQRDITILPISRIIESDLDTSPERFNANRPSPLEQIYPANLPKAHNFPAYLQASTASTQRKKRDAFAIGNLSMIFILSAIIVYGAGFFLPNALQDNFHVAQAITCAALTAILIRAIMQKEIYTKSANLISGLLGVIVAFSIL